MNIFDIKLLINSGKEHIFYTSSSWRKKADEVRRLDNYECQLCKGRGRYSRGEIVHHVKHLRDRPDLALMLFDPVDGTRQLITVCKACHELEHPEALRKPGNMRDALTAERWD